jgi:nicotinamidase-related amidase
MTTIFEPLNPKRVFLLVVDPQEKLLNVMPEKEKVIKKIALVSQSAKILNIPIFLTTQYQKGIGPVVSELDDALAGISPIDKMEFNCFENEDVKLAFSEIYLSRDIMLVVGIEAHICVFQTVMGAIKYGFKPYIVGDAITSRNLADKDLAMARFAQMGVVVGSAEMAIYEMLKKAGTDEFKAILKHVVANS